MSSQVQSESSLTHLAEPFRGGMTASGVCAILRACILEHNRPFRDRACAQRENFNGTATFSHHFTVDLRNPLEWGFCGLKRSHRGKSLPPFGPRDSEIVSMEEPLRGGSRGLDAQEKEALLEFAVRRSIRA